MKITTANMKKAIKEAMTKYKIDVHDASKLALTNYPEAFDQISKATIKITQEEMGIA